MFFEPKIVRKARKAGVQFEQHWYAESPTTNRGCYCSTKEDGIKYVGPDAILSQAWKGYHKDFPHILAFGRSKVDCASRLMTHFF